MNTLVFELKSHEKMMVACFSPNPTSDHNILNNINDELEPEKYLHGHAALVSDNQLLSLSWQTLKDPEHWSKFSASPHIFSQLLSSSNVIYKFLIDGEEVQAVNLQIFEVEQGVIKASRQSRHKASHPFHIVSQRCKFLHFCLLWNQQKAFGLFDNSKEEGSLHCSTCISNGFRLP